jgi:hypothetical protein
VSALQGLVFPLELLLGSGLKAVRAHPYAFLASRQRCPTRFAVGTASAS